MFNILYIHCFYKTIFFGHYCHVFVVKKLPLLSHFNQFSSNYWNDWRRPSTMLLSHLIHWLANIYLCSTLYPDTWGFPFYHSLYSFSILISETTPIFTLHIYFLSLCTSLSIVYMHLTESEYLLYTYFTIFYSFTLLQLLPTYNRFVLW